MPKVAVVMGSKSDLDIIRPAIDTLKKFGVEVVAKVMSAHRTPVEAHDFSINAEKDGIEVIIACAGKAAHLGGVIASFTTLPVIGLPVFTSATAGMDSLLSMVQMPAGIPVAVVALNGAENAAILAVQMLALKHSELKSKLAEHKKTMRDKVLEDDAALAKML